MKLKVIACKFNHQVNMGVYTGDSGHLCRHTGARPGVRVGLTASERARPQSDYFYGGWITDEIVGP